MLIIEKDDRHGPDRYVVAGYWQCLCPGDDLRDDHEERCEVCGRAKAGSPEVWAEDFEDLAIYLRSVLEQRDRTIKDLIRERDEQAIDARNRLEKAERMLETQRQITCASSNLYIAKARVAEAAEAKADQLLALIDELSKHLVDQIQIDILRQ